jgi:hypothetical protein
MAEELQDGRKRHPRFNASLIILVEREISELPRSGPERTKRAYGICRFCCMIRRVAQTKPDHRRNFLLPIERMCLTRREQGGITACC